MTKSKTNPKADFYFDNEKKWKAEITMLRSIILDCGLKEELKWGSPCYTVDEDANVVLIHVFKEYCAVLFFKGAIMKDPDGILIQQTKNVQSARQVRFINAKEVTGAKKILKSYIKEAIAIERAGLKVTLKKPTEFAVAEEFQNRLNDSAALKKAFHALTPGRQRGYLLYFSSAKQPKTRESRVDKCIPQILKGKGLED